jgi:hypothetical protein
MRIVVAIAAVMLLGGSGAWAADEAKPKGGASAADQKIADELKVFCKKWMGFLETRERDNRKAVKWQPKGDGVAGQYVGYSKEYDCTLKERSSNGTPIATIVYREYIYEHTGASRDAALSATPTVVEATEVTEIFRYTKGQWVY